MNFRAGPEHGMFSFPFPRGEADMKVWCWGWDGAGDLDGPDVDPVWYVLFPHVK